MLLAALSDTTASATAVLLKKERVDCFKLWLLFQLKQLPVKKNLAQRATLFDQTPCAHYYNMYAVTRLKLSWYVCAVRA